MAVSENGTLRYIHQDHLTGTSLMTEASGNQIDTTVKYYPFGGTRSGSVPTDRLFTGQRLDDTGLYFYNARYYDATIGRFVSPDTIIPSPANPQSFNRYSYCLNNPLKYVDPSGHDPSTDGYDDYLALVQLYNDNPVSDLWLDVGINVGGAVDLNLSYEQYQWGIEVCSTLNNNIRILTLSGNEVLMTSAQYQHFLDQGITPVQIALAIDQTGFEYSEVTIQNAYTQTEIDSANQAASLYLAAVPFGPAIPGAAYEIYNWVMDHNGSPPPGYSGGKVFRNDKDPLPPGQYREYDIYPKPTTPGVGRAADRIIINQSGARWYWDHDQGYWPF